MDLSSFLGRIIQMKVLVANVYQINVRLYIAIFRAMVLRPISAAICNSRRRRRCIVPPGMQAVRIPVGYPVARRAGLSLVPSTAIVIVLAVCKGAVPEQDRRRNDDNSDCNSGSRAEQPIRISLRLETRSCRGTSLEPPSRCRRHEFGFHCVLPLGCCVYACASTAGIKIVCTACAARRLAAPHPLTLRGAGSNLVVARTLTSPSSAPLTCQHD